AAAGRSWQWRRSAENPPKPIVYRCSSARSIGEAAKGLRVPRKFGSHAAPVCVRRVSMRPSRRAPDELRAVSLERGVVKYAEGSCFVKFGDTHVLVTATLEERLPPWLKGQGRGWVTAEY